MVTDDPVSVKLREAEFNLERLSSIVKRDEFYFNVNAFLSSARSVLYVACHQYGWEELRTDERALVSPTSEADKRRFDVWYHAAPSVSRILHHPLAEERHEVIHRNGQAGFTYVPKPIGGLALEAGDAFRTAPFIQHVWKQARNLIGLPLTDDNFFFYQTLDGQRHDAITFCHEFFALVRSFHQEIRAAPWRI